MENRQIDKAVFMMNNFNLIRLFAAFQVLILHSLHYLQLPYFNTFQDLLRLFPGVPIFFFTSGFLISKSYDNKPDLSEYFRNRALRIFPALIVCTILALLSVYISGYLMTEHVSFFRIVALFLGQITILQFYNPDFMRGFGTGVLNGSLWSITVELQFYVVVPVMYWVLSKFRKSQEFIIVVVTIAFLLLYIFYSLVGGQDNVHLMIKLLGVSFIPWVWMFLVGFLFQRNFTTLHIWLKGKSGILLAVYIVASYLSNRFLHWQLGNVINPLLFLILACLVFSLAYTLPETCKKLMGKNDISYGLYIYHIPVINIFMYNYLTGQIKYYAFALITIVIMATISWNCVEKPFLRLKRSNLLSLNKS